MQKGISQLFNLKVCLISILSFIFILLIDLSDTFSQNSLINKTIVIDPGHGGTASFDSYRVGPTGEREEWINLRVAKELKDLLKEKGSNVILTRQIDVQVELQERAKVAKENKADLFLSIHHNATADPDVNFPIVYYHGYASANEASVVLGKEIILELKKKLYNNDGPVSLVSDHTIFPGSGAKVLRETYNIPGVLIEASLFTNPEEEQRLKKKSYNLLEAKAIASAIENYFSDVEYPVHKMDDIKKIDDFSVFQEAERMNEQALLWKDNFTKGVKLFEKGGKTNFLEAYELFTLSVKSFPDSPVARQCHLYRAEILNELGKYSQANMENLRVKEFYIDIKN
ncbi:MAG: N-acetylmuramoyl-L-alanine amidase [Brumimicrobium sp.]